MKHREHPLSAVRFALKKKSLADYGPLVGEAVIDEIRTLARDIKGLRVLQLNSTAYGGGVAELLTALVPLEAACGLRVEWKTLPQHVEFFEVTKMFHNALQGMEYERSAQHIEDYLDHNRLTAEGDRSQYDIVITHDPQPAAFRHFAGEWGAKWIWRCHIDTSEPSRAAWDFLRPFVNEYDACVFTMKEFLPPGIAIPEDRIFFIPPAIDPLSTKNFKLSDALSNTVLAEFGVDSKRPLMTQVARFDPWKDQPGTIQIYRKLKEQIPGLQLALIGSMANDDPEAWSIYAGIEGQIKDDADAFIFTNLNGAGSLEVNAFQRLSDIVIQKSIREGFGLVVSEALWKSTPVVAGDTGGIPLQMSDGTGGFLAHSEDEYVARSKFLLENPAEAAKIAAAGRDFVRDHFLITRLLRDELKLFRSLVL